MPDNNKLPPEIVDHWPEIFDDIEIKAVPIQYIKNITVTFDDGKTWIIDVKKSLNTKNDLSEIEDSLEDFFNEYDEYIDSVDFNLDTEKVKRDIIARTKTFMKRRR